LSDFLCETASEYENEGLSALFNKNMNELYVNIDVLQFRNVLHNVLSNSAKYKVDQTVESKITCGENDGNIVVTITDNGSGVPDSSLDKLFDVFYRNDVSRKDPSSGSGLGLAIARKIIERFGGTIHAENVPNGGLAIVIILPKSGGTV
jgi:signal transduction histidine kinase